MIQGEVKQRSLKKSNTLTIRSLFQLFIPCTHPQAASICFSVSATAIWIHIVLAPRRYRIRYGGCFVSKLVDQEQLSISYPGLWLLASCTSTYTFCKVPIIPRKSAFLRAFICCRMKLSFSLSVSQNRFIAMSVCVGIVKQSFGSSGGKLVAMACSWCGRNDLVMVQTVRVAQNGYCKTTAKFAGSRILIAVLARPPSNLLSHADKWFCGYLKASHYM